ncbi:lysylphosphatidylglycerol synthase transmembrane domain-containing protein [Bergeyella zoohelcum]|uniref:Uncharacterized protein n=1 Tax=Bergeyella zoohelcum TaxID=1015 RepID=A0A376C1K4_9FLAO|nr:lysylphosphatidylglycerol synthase transmembrane domain-containing protein [Bergeyella zoohelcum]EKB58523.1 hypothetical protein HMPREF9700_01975 [Bergeyella zoohelcum CCUG 30536]SSZ55894.1 Uncharacterised protein family (UPF0104) [Bergeyella zoohelcum]
MVKKIITVVLSILVGVFFMWLATRGLDFKEIQNYFANANYFWVALAAVFGLLAYWFRAVRWNIMFEPMGYRSSVSNSFWSISFGYLMNLTIPRSGELARATALYKVEKIPVENSFGTIVLERIIDLLCMMLFLILTFVLKSDAIQAFWQQAQSGSQNGTSSSLGYGIAGIGLLGTILFFSLRKKLEKNAFFAKIYKIVDGLLDGLLSIFKLRKPGVFIFHSLMIWVCYYLAAYLVCFALPETAHFSIADGFFLIVVGTFGMMVPASGGIGAFHFALKIGVGALFLSMGKSFEEGAQVGLAYAFISHTMQLVIMLVMGLISIPMLAKAKKGEA